MKPRNRDHEFLQEELRRLNLLIARAADRGSGHYGGSTGLAGLAISHETFQKTLETKLRDPLWPDPEPDRSGWADRISEQDRRIEELVEAGFEKEHAPRLVGLVWLCGLQVLDLRILVAALAPELDPAYGLLYGFLQDNLGRTRPSPDLLNRLFREMPEEGTRVLARLQPESPLCRYGLVHCDAMEDMETPRIGRSLRVDQRVLRYLFQWGGPDPGCAGFCTVRPPSVNLKELSLPDWVSSRFARFFKDQVRALFLGESGTRFFQFHGPAGVGKAALAEGLCRELGWFLLDVDLAAAAVLGEDPETLTQAIVREAMLGPAVIYLRQWETSDSEGNKLRRMLAWRLKHLPRPTVIAAETRLELTGELGERSCFEVPLPRPGYAARRRIWETALSESGAGLHADRVSRLADRFRLTPGQIRQAVARTVDDARLHRHRDGERALAEACRCLLQTRLPAQARKIEPRYTWDDIVLPAETRTQLEEICGHVAHRRRIFEAWGFAEKMSLGKGLHLLFLGPSGTGKTMAAEVMAHTLELDLYQVDLSSLVSKYIGETEKNLERIFRETEQLGAMLFFDEADAVFGKRTELKDAHDRYANIGVSYLLQRIEAYDGIVVLASNFHNNLDEAFVRRIRTSVEFPFPDETQRAAIWRKVFPKKTPLSPDIDFEFLARQFEISGGHIRNTALTAAFLAAETGSVTMEHLVLAVKREFQKMGRLQVKCDFGPYFEWVADAPLHPASNGEGTVLS